VSVCGSVCVLGPKLFLCVYYFGPVRGGALSFPLVPLVWVCVFITAVPSTKLFACVGGETMEDVCYERLRAEACVD